MSYRAYGLILESNVPLPELAYVNGNGGEAECSFQFLPMQGPGPASSHGFHHWRLPNGEIWLSWARQGSGYLLRFHDLADFLVSTDGKEIRCYSAPNTPLETVRHLFLDQVLPLVLSYKGRLVLHASAVVTPEGAIAFLGVTGQGKSTLTGSFVKQGFSLLTDDCLLVKEEEGQLFGIPSYPGLRLWPDVLSTLFGQQPVLSEVAHYTEKKRLSLNNGLLPYSANPAPLQRMYVVAPHKEIEDKRAITIAPLSSRDAFIELAKHACRLDTTDRERLSEEFECLGRVAATLVLHRLAFPRDLSLLSAVREAILENLSER
jgi:hypothetical protein